MSPASSKRYPWAAAVVFVASVATSQAEPYTEAPEALGHVRFHQKISDTEGGFTGVLLDGNEFGNAVAPLGDLDGDGNPDLAVGVQGDSDGGGDRGAVWVLFLHPNGTVKSHQKISDTAGGFMGGLDDFDGFGSSVASIGDLDRDGSVDLIVGARGDDDGGDGRGAVWVLFLHANGTVKGHQKISDTAGGFAGVLDDIDLFGETVASLGPGTGMIAVGAPRDDDGGSEVGAVWILFLDTNGTVQSHQKISATQGGFSGMLGNTDLFGVALGSLGDLDNDGNPDLAVGSAEGTLPVLRGSIWVLFLHANGSVKGHQKVGEGEGDFTGTLEDQDRFGGSLASLGDLDCDGTVDLVAGAQGDDDGGPEHGAAWIPFLSPQGTVRLHTKISDTSGGFTGALSQSNFFGRAVATVGDLDGDGNADLAVGAHGDNDGGINRGAVWILFLDGNGCFGRLFRDGFESGDTSAWSNTQP